MTVHHNMTLSNSATAYYVESESQPSHIQAGETVELVFTIWNSNRETVHDLQIVHEQAIYLLVVSKEFSEFYHLHPEQKADGRYRLYADYTPTDAHQIKSSYF